MRKPSQNIFFYLVGQAWFFAGAQRWRMIVFYMMSFIANAVSMVLPYVLSKIIDVAQVKDARSLDNIIFWSLVYLGSIIVFWLLHGPARVIERRLAYYIYENFVTTAYVKITELPLRWHQDHHSGDTINRVTKAGRALQEFSQEQFVKITMFVQIVVPLVALLLYSWWVGIGALLSSVAIVAIVLMFDRILISLYDKYNEAEHRIASALYDYIGNIITILTLRLQGHTKEEIQHRLLRIKAPLWREITINEVKWGIIDILRTLMQIGLPIAYLVPRLAQPGPLAIGPFVGIFQYLRQINAGFSTLAATYGTLTRQFADVSAVRDIWGDHLRLSQAQQPFKATAWQDIEIKDLSFNHHEGEDQFHHLRNIQLRIKAGEKIALVGPSGAGKSTLLTLLRGLYETQQVLMSVDDKAYRSLAPLAAFTTLIPQDTEIFENTILYNMTLGIKLEEADLRLAMQIAVFDGVVDKLPQGAETDIRERGVNLSGGQKQRLAMTRGLIAARDSSLILLDEPTSSVDMVTENLIFDRMFAAYGDKAVIASVHRLHLLPRFDRIYFMRDGAIVQQGSFRELSNDAGPFLDLWRDYLAHSATEDGIVT